jgi:hypothetical protein
MSNVENLNAFVELLKKSNIHMGQSHAACHHSAVEVNEWDRISAEIKAAIQTKQEKSAVV